MTEKYDILFTFSYTMYGESILIVTKIRPQDFGEYCLHRFMYQICEPEVCLGIGLHACVYQISDQIRKRRIS